jgi:hypothetical protein
MVVALATGGGMLWAQETKAPTVKTEVQVGPPGSTPVAPGTQPAPAASPAAAENPLGPPIKRVLRRNPFVPPSMSGAGPSTASTPQTPVGPTGPPRPTATTARPAPPPPEIKPDPPTFALVGIVTSRGFVRALLVTETGPREVRVGDTVQGFRVTAIDLDAREVTVQMKKHSWKVGLPKDTPYGSGGAPASGGSPGGQPPSGPPPGGPPAGGPGPLPPPPAPR